MNLQPEHIELWLAMMAQTTVCLVASIKYILRIERRLMAIELELKIEPSDNRKRGNQQ